MCRAAASALLRVPVFGKEMTVSTAASVGTGAQLGYALPPGEDKTSARESGAALPLGVRPGTAAIRHACTTPSEFKCKVAKDLLFLRVL